MFRLLLRQRLNVSQRCRFLSTTPVPTENSIRAKLEQSLKVESISVQDISGGCGAMFQVGFRYK